LKHEIYDGITSWHSFTQYRGGVVKHKSLFDAIGPYLFIAAIHTSTLTSTIQFSGLNSYKMTWGYTAIDTSVKMKINLILEYYPLNIINKLTTATLNI